MEEGAAVAAATENPAAPVAVPEAAVVVEQHAEGSTAVPMVVPEEDVVTEQHAKGVTVPMAAQEEAVGAGQCAEGVTVPMVVPEKAAEGSTVPMVVPEKAAEGSAVPMVAPEKAADAEEHVEGSTVPMVVPEEAASGDQHAEGSAVPMVLSEEAVVTDQHVEGVTAPMVVPEEPVVTDKHVQGVTAPMVVPEAAADADHHIEDATTQDKHGDAAGIINVTPEEMRSIIEVIAETGKFWHEWSFLKRILSLQLMQVLGEYSEAQMVMIREDGQQQNSLSAETHSELFNQLNDALQRFEEGPPFTLQRLCEILLDPKGTYKKLPKLALALEKTLLVTSTITKFTDPYPTAQGPNPEGTAITENTDPVNAEPETLPEHPVAVSNGTQHAGGDGDEEMTDAEAEVVPGTHDDVEMQEKPDHIADVNSDTTSGAAVACETAVSASDQSPDPQS